MKKIEFLQQHISINTPLPIYCVAVVMDIKLYKYMNRAKVKFFLERIGGGIPDVGQSRRWRPSLKLL